MNKADGVVSDAELESFIQSLKKRSFTHRDVTRCYSTFVKNEYHQNDDSGQQPPEIYGRQRSGGKRIPVRWSEQETEALKEGVAKLGKGNWSRIIGLYPDIFGPTARTGRDLKKKWNSIESKGNNIRRNHSTTRLKATLILPNNEIPGMTGIPGIPCMPVVPSTIQGLSPILPVADINPNEAIINSKDIKDDQRLTQISNPTNLMSMQNCIIDKRPDNLIMKDLKNGKIDTPDTNFSTSPNILLIPDIQKEPDVTDLMGIQKEADSVFRISDENHQILMSMNLNDSNSTQKLNEKEMTEERDNLNK